jgi:plastocyanin
MRIPLVRRGIAALVLAAAAAACGGGSKQQETTAPAATTVPAPPPIDPATVGSITGKITLDGKPPAAQPIKTKSDPNCHQALHTETYWVGSGGTLGNVFVYVKDGLGNRVFPAPGTPVVLDQRDCHYVPHVFGIQVGQTLEIVNSDPTLHNIHFIPDANREFNMGEPIQGMRQPHVFSVKEVLIPIKCDVHNWMNAYAGVVDNPFYAVTGEDGTFTLKGLPPGTYTIEAVHEKLGRQTQTITIGPKETKDAAFTFKI